MKKFIPPAKKLSPFDEFEIYYQHGLIDNQIYYLNTFSVDKKYDINTFSVDNVFNTFIKDDCQSPIIDYQSDYQRGVDNRLSTCFSWIDKVLIKSIINAH